MNRTLTLIRSYTLRLTAAVSLSMFLAVFVSSLSFAQSDGGIGGRPANPIEGNERSKSIFVKTIDAGKTVDDAVVVVNNSNVAKTIQVYATDAIPSSGGAFACAQALEAPMQAGKWITLSSTSVLVSPNSTTTVPLTIAVPANTEPGEQNGCIVLQEEKAPTIQNGVGLSFRTAIRVAILVPGEIRKSIETLGLSVGHSDGKIVVTPKVKNTGNVSIDADVKASVKSLFGIAVGSENSTYPILRNQVTEWNFEIDSPFWGGFYNVGYSLEYDKSNNYIGSNGEKDLTTVKGPSQWFFAWPHPLALLIEIIILAAIGFGVWKLLAVRTQKKAIDEHWKTYTVVKGEQITDIAKKRKISWKLLAKVNKLQAPYTLAANQTLLVPPISRAKKTPPATSEKE